MKDFIENFLTLFVGIILLFIITANFFGALVGSESKCLEQNRLVFDNWITGGTFKLICKR